MENLIYNLPRILILILFFTSCTQHNIKYNSNLNKSLLNYTIIKYINNDIDKAKKIIEVIDKKRKVMHIYIM